MMKHGRDLYRVRDEILVDTEPHEMYHLSFSARKKYLSEEDRQYYQLRRAEMFGMKTFSGPDDFVATCEYMERSFPAYRTKNDRGMPPHATVLYLSLNPHDSVVAYKKTMEEYNNLLVAMATSNKKNDQAFEQFNRVDSTFRKHLANSRSRKIWLDVDFDLYGRESLKSYVLEFAEELTDKGVRFYVISTRGGYHVLLDRSTIDYDFHSTVRQLNSEVESITSKYGEVVVNKNGMVPCPGTYQAGGHFVRFVDMVELAEGILL